MGILQVLGGTAGAITLGLTGWRALDNPEGRDRRVKGDAGYTPNANTAFALGSFLGATWAVYSIGRRDGSDGSMERTIIGAAIPTVVMLFGRHEPYLPILGSLLGAPAQAIGATIGYQTSRVEPGR